MPERQLVEVRAAWRVVSEVHGSPQQEGEEPWSVEVGA